MYPYSQWHTLLLVGCVVIIVICLIILSPDESVLSDDEHFAEPGVYEGEHDELRNKD